MELLELCISHHRPALQLTLKYSKLVSGIQRLSLAHDGVSDSFPPDFKELDNLRRLNASKSHHSPNTHCELPTNMTTMELDRNEVCHSAALNVHVLPQQTAAPRALPSCLVPPTVWLPKLPSLVAAQVVFLHPIS